MRDETNILEYQASKKARPIGTPMFYACLFIGLMICVTTFYLAVPPKKSPSRGTSISEISGIKGGLKAFEVDNGRFPTNAEGLRALVICPPHLGETWKPGGYLDRMTVPNDKWGRPYQYVSPGKTNPNMFDLYSAGPDGIPGTPDDVSYAP